MVFSCAWAAGDDQQPLATPQTSVSSAAAPKRKEVVVVTGEPQAVPLEDADRSVSVIDTRENPELFHSWTDYAGLDPTLDLQQRAPNGVQGDLSIRGSSFSQTLVLINGLRVDDPQTAHHNLDISLPLSSLERIEVLRGAGSTLYGSDAMGGAVNFLASPPAISQIRLGSSVGNFGTNSQDGSLAYQNRRFSGEVSFDRDFSSGFMADRDYRNLSLGSTGHIASPLGDSSYVLAYGDRPFGANDFYGAYPSWERTKSWLALFSQQLGQSTQVAFGYRRHTDNYVLVRDDPGLYANNHVDDTWQGAVRRRQSITTNGTLFYGGEFFRDAIASNNLGHHERNRGAGYVSYDLRAWRRFSFTIGAREEVYSSLQQQFSPSVSGGVWLSSHLKMHAAASHAFRLPSYTDLYYSDPTTVGNPYLRPEYAWSFEGGLDWRASDKLDGAVVVFHRREHNGIDYVKFFPTDLWHAWNIGRLRFTGVETSVRWRVARQQQIQLSYVGMHGFQPATLNIISRYVGNYPSNSAVASWQGRLPGGLTGRTRIGAMQRNGRDTYGLWDLALSRTIQRFSPYIQLSNLTDTSYQDIAGIILPGRSVIVGCEIYLLGKTK